MPKPEVLTQFPGDHKDWNYNWGLLFSDVAVDASSIRMTFTDEPRFSQENFPLLIEMMVGYDNGRPAEYLVEQAFGRRNAPSLTINQEEYKVSCRSDHDQASEYREIEEAHINTMRKRLSDYSAALNEKQIEIAYENPEGASLLRFMRDKANFALQNYGSEAMNDEVYNVIRSQMATIHLPTGDETDPVRRDFSSVMDQLSDMPFIPVFENASRMVNIACDHANAARAGTLTARQDRLSRRLLLTQYDHVSSGLLETRRIVRKEDESVAKDYQRWAKVMDNEPDHVSTGSRAPLYAPDNLEGRRIALRQGWPVEDAALIGSLFELQARIERPVAFTDKKYSNQLKESLAKLLEEIGSTRITGPESRTAMLDRVEGYLSANVQGLYLSKDALKLCFLLRKAEKILPCQYLSAEELDAAAREYDRRKALPEQAGSDRSPTGYFEQAVAGTEVMSRLSAMHEVMGRLGEDGMSNLTEFNALRGATGRLLLSMSILYGPNPPEGQARTELLYTLTAEHARISQLAQAYLAIATKKEPAFRKAAAQELKSFCESTARTAMFTYNGMEKAEGRRRLQDWRIEKDNLKGAPPQVMESRLERSEVEDPRGGQPKVDEESRVKENVGQSEVKENVVEVKEPVAQPSFQQDTESYLNYLNTIWGEYLQLKATPEPDALDYRAVTERGFRLAELERKLKPLQDVINDCGLDYNGTKQLVELSAQKDQLGFTFEDVLHKASNSFKGLLNDLCQSGKLERKRNSENAAWAKMKPEQQQQKVAEILKDMAEGKYFDATIFSDYATPQQRLEIAERRLSQEQINRAMRVGLHRLAGPMQDPLKIYRHLPEVLGAERLRSVVEKLDNDPVIHDSAKPTRLPEPDAEAIARLRSEVEAGQLDSTQKDAYLNALDRSKVILHIATPEAKAGTEQKEHISSAALNQYHKAVVAKARKEDPGISIDRNGPLQNVKGVSLLVNASNEGTEKILNMPKLPDRARDTILKMLRKMDEMKLIPDDATKFRIEEGGKFYGYRGIGFAKLRVHQDVISGNLWDLPDAIADYEREYQNINDLLDIAREGFGNAYTNAPDMYVTRDPAKYAWEQIDNPLQAQINTVFMLYQEMRKYGMTPEGYMDGFPGSSLRPWLQFFQEECAKQGAATEDFAATIDVLTSPNVASEIDTGSNHPPVRCLVGFAYMPDDPGFDRDGMSAWTQDAENQFYDFYQRERLRFATLAERATDEDPLFTRIRSESIQNLLTVADRDRDISRMVGLPGYSEDLKLKEPFSLDHYIRTHEIDAAGMMQRLETMIQIAEKKPNGPYREELLAEGLEACTRVLTIHAAERGSADYTALETLAQNLLEYLPTREALSKQKNVDKSRIDNLSRYRTRMENTLRRYRDFMAEPPLNELVNLLKDANVSPEANEDFDLLRCSVQALSELSNSLMYPHPDGTLPQLTPQSRADLQEAYAKVSNFAAMFCASAEKDPNLAQARENAQKIAQMASRDMNILGGLRGAEIKTLADIYQKRSLTLDVTDLEPQIVGGASSNRYGFKIPLGEGRFMDGFFTPEQPKRSREEEMDELMKRIGKASPNAAKILPLLVERSTSFKKLKSMNVRSTVQRQQINQSKYWDYREYDHRYDDCLREAGFTNDQIRNVTDKAFADAIDDYLLNRARIDSHDSLCESMEIRPGDPIELRNGAMSAVADALGIGSLLAASRPVTLVRNGKPVHGVFMDRAVGSDSMNPRENDPILEMTEDTALSPRAVRELASIQVLDYICGNVDRHPGNLLYTFTKENGKLVLDGIQGIDNDLSFMGCDSDASVSMYQVDVSVLPNMPKSLADRVMQLSPASLRIALREFRLPEQQIERAAERLKDVQRQIASGKEYFRDKDLNEFSAEHIRVIPDEDYAKVSPDLLPIRSLLSAIPATVNGIKAERELLIPRNNIREDERKTAELYQRAEASDKSVWFGSKEFETMKNALLAYGQQHRALITLSAQDRQAGRTSHIPTTEELQNLQESANRLKIAADGYLLRKQNEQQRKGNLDRKSQARVEIARQIRGMLQPQAVHIAEMSDALRREAQPAAARTQSVKKQNQNSPEDMVSRPPTAKERLNQLLGTLTEQRRLRGLVKDKQLDRKAPEVLSDKELIGKLVEAFAAVEIVNAAGTADIRVDDNCVDLMCNALRTDAKEAPKQFEEYMTKIREAIPGADLTKVHQNDYADMRAAIRQSMMDPAKVGERLEMMIDFLKKPGGVFAEMGKHAEKLKKENNELAPKEIKPGNKRGM